MGYEKTNAIVLRSVDFSETSKVLTLFSDDLGKLSVLAKGARRLKSSFEVALDLLSVCSIGVLRKSSDSLDILTEAVLVERFDGFRRNLAALYAGYYVAEILEALTDRDDPHPGLYAVTLDTLRRLSNGTRAVEALNRYQLLAMKDLGYEPNLRHCVGCGREVRRKKRVVYSVSSGGVACAECTRVRDRRSFQAATIDLLEDVLEGAEDRSDAGGQQHHELWRLTSESICHLLGKKPRMLAMLNI